jgi:putative FmdB family regulatory protein
MPTYEYRCDKCACFFEEFQSITAAPLKTCPQCGGSVQRLISTGNGFLFKGSGFYITDYRGKNYTKEKERDEKPKTSDEKSKIEKGKATSTTE